MLIPCIDLQGGQAVQLVGGRRPELAVRDVLGQLAKFRRYRWLHIIDLDAAVGTGHNTRLVRALCLAARRKYRMKVRVGGGIRTVSRARALAKLGASQIIVGSAAFRDGRINTRFLGRLVAAVPRSKIVIALDTAKGRITVAGWRKRLALRAQDVMPALVPYCGAFLCTDVDREGRMTGANLRWFRMLRAATAHPVIAAGGVRSRRDVAALERMGMDAAVGMAVYKNRLR